MTGIKLCGLTRLCDMEAANELKPEYIGFVFAAKSRRYVTPEQAAGLRQALDPAILAVGVFVNEDPERVAELLNEGIIDLAQLHGNETETYIKRLRQLTKKPLIQAFSVDSAQAVMQAQESTADYILLDSGRGGTGTVFDWDFLKQIKRPYFFAGGLDIGNVAEAVERFHPYAVDVSSGIETDGVKDREKMRQFVTIVRSGRRETR
ncbi:phosphoribosylanthranilate isomerase [Fusibacillus kribbianus]|uniref:N-(5'-phosphoribosyl)anthranilate isomerase n=1 Tax=Fusibacillus kribbianus TaxID=3044208 RepID=A0AAP4BD79_9FIRM|nr:phosphoribosylanthranilate isomerase [Ruminococcus sp. YH-rum2234]MDI9242928.1 phosphoribosylanthranilate isomerase [Ruminococcus sp. YH-rum2234]